MRVASSKQRLWKCSTAAACSCPTLHSSNAPLSVMRRMDCLASHQCRRSGFAEVLRAGFQESKTLVISRPGGRLLECLSRVCAP